MPVKEPMPEELADLLEAAVSDSNTHQYIGATTLHLNSLIAHAHKTGEHGAVAEGLQQASLTGALVVCNTLAYLANNGRALVKQYAFCQSLFDACSESGHPVSEKHLYAAIAAFFFQPPPMECH